MLHPGGLTVVIIALLGLPACIGGVSTPTQFYVLSAPQPDNTTAADAAAGLSIGLGPVKLPDILDRPQIVSRDNDHDIVRAEFHHWAGSLSENVQRVMAQVLMNKLNTQRVTLYPWPRHRHLDYQVRVDALRFDGMLGGDVVFAGTWTLLDGDANKELSINAFRLQTKARDNSYHTQVQALSELTLRLGEQVAGEISKLAQ